MQNNPLCILAAGRGSRLGAFTSAVNKALLPVNGKAVISHIIEKVSTESEIIIALGYQSQKVKDYCLMAYPERNFIFVDVPNFDDPNSGPGTSMLACKKYLQRPFYFSTVDCIVVEDFEDLDCDWIGISKTDDPQSFSTVKVDSYGLVSDFINKNLCGYENAFIGLAGVKSYLDFWNNLNSSELVSVYNNCYESAVFVHDYTWLDTGTIESYAKARKYFEGDQQFDFDKVGEFTYIVNGKVIKYFDDKNRIANRVFRAEEMLGVPEIQNYCDNFFSYKFVPGKTIYESLHAVDPINLFNWLHDKLWSKTNCEDNFAKSCHKFYHDKTLERFEAYKRKKKIKHDVECMVNGVLCKPMEHYLNNINWEDLVDGKPVIFHGDLQFDNIIVKTDGEFMLLDWRDCFADQLITGDMYYDYAKLNGGMILPYSVIKSGDFMFYRSKAGSIVFHYDVDEKLVEFRNKFKQWIGKDCQSKVELLTTLIYLNMSPLHAEPFDDLVFSLAKQRFATYYND